MINTYDFTISHPDIFKSIKVQDILFLHYKCPQVEKQVQLWTHYNVIAYAFDGLKTFIHGGKSYEISSDKSLFLRKTAYAQERDDVVGWEVLAFCFQDEFLKKVFNEYREFLPLKNLPPAPKDMLFEIQVNETIKAFCYSMIPYFKQKIPLSHTLLELRFKELLFTIFAEPKNAGLLSYAASIVDQYLTPVNEIMEANYMFNLTLNEFAKMSGRSVTTFKRDFLNYYDTSPGKWLTEKRLQRAEFLLSTSPKSVGEISLECGFENLSHFSRVFKEKYTLSPTQYRKKLAN